MRQIKPSKANVKQILAQVEKFLTQEKHYQNKITIDLEDLNKELIQKTVKKPTVLITTEAYNKMNALVQECDKEIGFHGVVEKEGNTYTITDILVYPQKVTGVTVETDDDEILKWQLSIPAETYNKLRMQGHSHVNMGATPSNVDHNLYKTFLSALPNNDFYIFLITNKRGTIWMNIFDLAQNMLFETKDIDIVIECEYLDWVDEQLKLVKTKTYTQKTALPFEDEKTLSEYEQQLEAYYNKIYGGENGLH